MKWATEISETTMIANTEIANTGIAQCTYCLPCQ